MKLLRILLAVAVLLTAVPCMALSVSAAPAMTVNKTVYTTAETITVTYNGTDTNDWTGIYPADVAPGTLDSLTWQYTVGSGSVTFAASELGTGDYVVYLCDNNGYTVLARAAITIINTDATNYGAVSASVKATVKNGKSEIDVTVTPSSAAALTYEFYWAKNGKRLDGYLPLKDVTHSGAAAFTVSLNDCLFMPDAADSIEVAVREGRSLSCFAAAPSVLKVPASTKKYEFQVLTDVHISTDIREHVSNLKSALTDVAANSSNSLGIFFVGDNTDRGTQAHYDLLKQTINSVGVTLPPMYFAMGNHDQVYGGTYDEEIARFLQNLNMPGLYYSVDLNGSRFIVLGSNEQSTAGEINDTQIAWLQNQLAQTDPSTPVFLFMHQSLKDTVSGSLTSMGQAWYGVPKATEKMRAILKNYPNAILFSGHTHWALEETQPFLYGNGVDANFMNAASVGYLWTDEDTERAGSEGLYVEVYEDYMLIKGREFVRGKWCAAAQFLIPLDSYRAQAYDGYLIPENASAWVGNAATMKVEQDAYATAFYNTDGNWPYADYVYDAPMTVDPNSTSLYVDMVLEEGASTNILVQAGGVDVSLSPYIPKLEALENVGDLIGNGVRVRGTIPLSDIAFDAACYNRNGTITLRRTRVYASGEASAKLHVYDLRIVHDDTPKRVSLMNAQTLIADSTRDGSYTYDNGVLTLNAATDNGYAVTFSLDENYDVAALQNWLVRLTASAPFDMAITASTAKGDMTFSLSGDFWPALCAGLVDGNIPAGQYDHAVNLYSAYTFNNAATANGISTIKAVTVSLASKGTMSLDVLQLANVESKRVMNDGDYVQGTTSSIATGDINEDGDLTTSDARELLSFLLGSGELTDRQLSAADFDGNGEITTSDARAILKTVLA